MQFFDPFDFISTFGILFVVVPLFIVAVFIIIVIKVCQGFSQSQSGFTVNPPSFVIPDQHRERGRSDGSTMKTVRLPERCPSCGASLSHEEIDWTGPLEAKCSYCGGSVRAKFENI